MRRWMDNWEIVARHQTDALRAMTIDEKLGQIADLMEAAKQFENGEDDREEEVVRERWALLTERTGRG